MQYYKVILWGLKGYGHAIVYLQATSEDDAVDKALDLQHDGGVEWTLYGDRWGECIDLGFWKFGGHAIDSWEVTEVTQQEAEEALM